MKRIMPSPKLCLALNVPVKSLRRLCYNLLSDMRLKAIVRGTGAFIALTAIVALIAPLAGPMFDHHFAERQPGHLHIGASGEHSHAFESAYHLHKHPLPAPEEEGAFPLVLYKSEGSIAATLAASPLDISSESMRQYQPTSVFYLPLTVISAARQHVPHPPSKPPALPSPHPADFPIHPLDAA